MFNCIRLKTSGILESEKGPKFGNFLANLVEFRVSKMSFCCWDTLSQISRLQLILIFLFNEYLYN